MYPEPTFLSKIRTEREGFEPSDGLTHQQISSLPHSTTLPPLQVTVFYPLMEKTITPKAAYYDVWFQGSCETPDDFAR
jgi:hypothetical protein